MQIDPKLKMRVMAGEAIVLLSNKGGRDMTKVLALNPSSKLLWENLFGKEFTQEDVKKVLLENYEVEEEVAEQDSKKWIEQLKELGVILQ